MVLNWMELYLSFDDRILGHDTSNGWIARVDFRDCLERSIEFCNDGGCKESCMTFVDGFLE